MGGIEPFVEAYIDAVVEGITDKPTNDQKHISLRDP
jgi:hypothetical protein